MRMRLRMRMRKGMRMRMTIERDGDEDDFEYTRLPVVSPTLKLLTVRISRVVGTFQTDCLVKLFS